MRGQAASAPSTTQRWQATAPASAPPSPTQSAPTAAPLAGGTILFQRHDTATDRSSSFTISPDRSGETRIGPADADIACSSFSNDGAIIGCTDWLAYGGRPAVAAADTMSFARDGHTATLLHNGEVLIAGGFAPDRGMTSAELYQPDPRFLPVEGRADEGRCLTSFMPKLEMTLTQRANVNIQVVGWLDLGFGFDALVAHGGGTWDADVMFFRFEEVFDPDHLGATIKAPADLGAWIAHLPGVKVLAAPRKTTIGGRDGTVMDLIATKDVPLGPTPGFTEFPAAFGAGWHPRVFTADVNGAQVCIVIGVNDSDPEHNRRALDTLQPIVESITWV